MAIVIFQMAGVIHPDLVLSWFHVKERDSLMMVDSVFVIACSPKQALGCEGYHK